MKDQKIGIKKKFIINYKFKEGILELEIKKYQTTVGCYNNYYDEFKRMAKHEYAIAANLLYYILEPASYFTTNEQHKNPENIEKVLKLFDFVKNIEFDFVKNIGSKEFNEDNEARVYFDFKYLVERLEEYRLFNEWFLNLNDGKFYDKDKDKDEN